LIQKTTYHKYGNKYLHAELMIESKDADRLMTQRQLNQGSKVLNAF